MITLKIKTVPTIILNQIPSIINQHSVQIITIT